MKGIRLNSTDKLSYSKGYVYWVTNYKEIDSKVNKIVFCGLALNRLKVQ